MVWILAQHYYTITAFWVYLIVLKIFWSFLYLSCGVIDIWYECPFNGWFVCQVVQLYMSWGGVAALAPKLQLVGFQRVYLNVGQEHKCKLVIKAQQMALWIDEHVTYAILPGSSTRWRQRLTLAPLNNALMLQVWSSLQGDTHTNIHGQEQGTTWTIECGPFRCSTLNQANVN